MVIGVDFAICKCTNLVIYKPDYVGFDALILIDHFLSKHSKRYEFQTTVSVRFMQANIYDICY